MKDDAEGPDTGRDRADLDRALEDGVASGEAGKSWDDVIADARKKLELE